LVGIITLLLIALMAVGIEPVMADDIKMPATITGLEKGDEATLTLSLSPGIDPTGKPIFKQTVRSDGERSITVDIGTNLKDGYYLLLLEAPDKYFREPKGYLFQVYQSEIVNPMERTIVFDLIPPLARSYKPYRESEVSAGILDDETKYVAEALISLSAPMKQLQPSGTMRHGTGYHYAGPQADQDNTGVNGRFSVEDPGVVHDDTMNEFVALRVMARNDAGSQWIETGWAEVSWESDAQWMYEFDSDNHTWYFYSLPTDTILNVRVATYSGTTWGAYYYLSGTTWIGTRQADIGISTASMAENLGEVYTRNVNHPSLPDTTVDVGKLRVSGNWYDWTDPPHDTANLTGGPYSAVYTTGYTDFVVED